jgi:hypothetical protein
MAEASENIPAQRTAALRAATEPFVLEEGGERTSARGSDLERMAAL